MKQRCLTQIAVILLIVAFFSIGVIFAVFPGQITALVAARNLDTFAANTSSTSSVTDTFRALSVGITMRLRNAGLLLVILSLAGIVLRTKIQRYLSELLASLRQLGRKSYATLRQAIKTESSFHILVFLLILLATTAVRLVFITQPMRYDEAVTYNDFASVPFYVGISNYFAPGNHLFHTLLVHFVLYLGQAEWIIRLPAFLAGVALVPATYTLGRILSNKHAALIACAVVACSSSLVEYSTNARGYTLLCLIFLLTFIPAIYLSSHDDLAALSLFVILSSLGFYTMPTFLYPFGILVIWLGLSLLKGRNGQNLSVKMLHLGCAVFGVVLLTGLLYLPVYVVWDIKAVVANSYVQSLPFSDFISGLPTSLISTWVSWNRDIYPLIGLILLLGFVVTAIRVIPSMRNSRNYFPILPVAVVWCAILLIVQRVVPYVRVWLFLLPLYAIFAAAGLAYLTDWFGHIVPKTPAVLARLHMTSIAALALCLILGLTVVSTRAVYYSDETGTLRDAEAITIFLKGYMTQDDKVYATVPSDAPLLYYFRRYGLTAKYIAKTLDSLASARRVIIIVNKPNDSLDRQLLKLDKLGVVTSHYTEPELVQEYRFAAIYVLSESARQD